MSESNGGVNGIHRWYNPGSNRTESVTMQVTLSAETQKLVEQQMSTGRFASTDDLVRAALKSLSDSDYEGLDRETAGAIDEAEAQFERGEGRPWEDVRGELRARFIK